MRPTIHFLREYLIVEWRGILSASTFQGIIKYLLGQRKERRVI